jgi:hypothetical protein
MFITNHYTLLVALYTKRDELRCTTVRTNIAARIIAEKIGRVERLISRIHSRNGRALVRGGK